SACQGNYLQETGKPGWLDSRLMPRMSVLEPEHPFSQFPVGIFVVPHKTTTDPGKDARYRSHCSPSLDSQVYGPSHHARRHRTAARSCNACAESQAHATMAVLRLGTGGTRSIWECAW